MQRITHDAAMRFVFDRRTPPALTVDPGQSFIVETVEMVPLGRIRYTAGVEIPKSYCVMEAGQ